jgi:hypothetical protein
MELGNELYEKTPSNEGKGKKKNSDLETYVTAALVLRSTYGSFEKLKQLIRYDFPETLIVYQKTSPHRLKIVVSARSLYKPTMYDKRL